MKPLFEIPELLTLDGNQFNADVPMAGNGINCGNGCKGGCCNGCEKGAGDGKPAGGPSPDPEPW